MRKQINVTQPFLPPIEEYQRYIEGIWDSACLTNQGPLVQKLNKSLRELLDVPYLECVSNGTVALMLALRALGITEGEIITTPFSYVATVSSILWQGCTPVFADIDPLTLCIDPEQIRAKITSRTRAIVPVHVFGMPCDTKAIEQIAAEHGLKVIYDGAHAFGAAYQGRSLLSYGDVTTCSFHATKLFHTVEGGAVIARDQAVNETLQLAMRFGHNGDEHLQLGINGKISELHAAMGLSNLPYLPEILGKRKQLTEQYDRAFQGRINIMGPIREYQRNYAYYPVLFRSGAERGAVQTALASEGIYPRRYFYPSLNLLPYVVPASCPISEDIADRILCLPLYPSLDSEDQNRIIETILRTIMK